MSVSTATQGETPSLNYLVAEILKIITHEDIPPHSGDAIGNAFFQSLTSIHGYVALFLRWGKLMQKYDICQAQKYDN